MDVSWLEDFITLVEQKSFSSASSFRNCSQSAFSRRIQSLEKWLNIDLIDRSTYPAQLTKFGHEFYPHALQIIQQTYTIKNKTHYKKDYVNLAITHNLSLHFFPRWLYTMQTSIGNFKCKIQSTSTHDGIVLMLEQGCDLFITYNDVSQPIYINKDLYDCITLGKEIFAPYSRADWHGKALHSLLNNLEKTPIFLSYSNNSYLNRVTQFILNKNKIYFNSNYEADTAEALKLMAIEGHGIAFLPFSSVTQPLEQGLLVRADSVNDKIDLSTNLNILMYKRKNVSINLVDKIWNYVQKYSSM